MKSKIGRAPNKTTASSKVRSKPNVRFDALRTRVESEDGAPLTTSELALLCQVEARVVHEWAIEGKIRHFRTPGQHLRFHARDVADFLKSEVVGLPHADTIKRSTVVLCKAPQRTALRRNLRGKETIWVEDPFAALIAAGQERAANFVVERRALGSVDASAFIDAVASELPMTRIVWLGSVPKGKELLVAATEASSVRAFVE